MRYIFLLLTILSVKVSAQWTDSFADGNFNSNPKWNGDSSKFIVNTAGLLQLNSAAVNGSAYLSTPSPIGYKASWTFLVKMNFNPSSSNYAKVYLMSDNSIFTAPLYGYYLKIGGANDDLSLFRQEGANETLVADGRDKVFNTNIVNSRVKVTRDQKGNWQLLCDSTGGENYRLSGQGQDSAILASAFFGVQCVFTSTRSKDFYFDEFIVTGETYTDGIKPVITNFKVLDEKRVQIDFSEPLDSVTVNLLTNYTLEGNPLIKRNTYSKTNKSFELIFENNFECDKENLLKIKGLSDLWGLLMNDTVISFKYCQPHLYDIVINEIMADPTPPNELPEAEYLELYNRTYHAFDLTGYKLTIGSYTYQFPEFTFNPESYLLITSKNDEVQFRPFGNTLGLFTSSATLNNAGQYLKFESNKGELIDWVEYNDSWYGDNLKAQGGWSLERMDPSRLCAGGNNWSASKEKKGGTPGTVNSLATESRAKPAIKYFKVLDEKRIQISFTGPLDSVSANLFSNYTLEGNSLVKRNTYSKTNEDFELIFENSFECERDNVLKIKGLSDGCGLLMNDTVIPFRYCQPHLYDIVINEIMADPTPPTELPEAEYLELYNRTSHAFDLAGYKLTIGSNTYQFPEFTFNPESYLLITSKNDEAQFYPFGNTLGLFTSPSTLNNTGQYLKFENNRGELIDWVEYNDSWYGNSFKAQGGWALEQIDPLNPCGGKDNWIASNARTGGTPGNRNSVYKENPDITLPDLLRVNVPKDSLIELYFNEALDSTFATDINNYTVVDIGNPRRTVMVKKDFSVVQLVLPLPLIKGKAYSLLIKKNITDCAGNTIAQELSVPVGLPSYPDSADMIINEVLFNAKAGGADYVELYNCSTKILNARNLLIGTKINGKTGNQCRLSEKGFLINPGTYLVIAEDGEKIKPFYHLNDPKCLVDIPCMPSLDDKAAIIVLQNDTLRNIDEVSYSETLHLPTLKNLEGISLERVNPERSAYFPGNWHSAAEVADYGTPGYKNSQYLSDSVSSGSITLSDEIFSPDNDGYKDILQVSYVFDKPGCRVQVSIFDALGRLVRQLLNNELLGTSGFFTWDGTSDAGKSCNVGMYVIFIRTVFDDGTVKEYKRSCVLVMKR
jgi:hypothetical protein